MSVPGTVEGTVVLSDGPTETFYGVWLGENEDRALVVGINRNGYYGVFHVSEGERVFIEGWRRFPHVRQGVGTENRIWVNAGEESVVIRINDEVASVLEREVLLGQADDRLAIGGYVESWDRQTAVVLFHQIRVWGN
jgi:hypothetical protein